MRKPKLWEFEGGTYTTKEIHERFCKSMSLPLVYLRLKEGATKRDDILRRPKTSNYSHPKWSWIR